MNERFLEKIFQAHQAPKNLPGLEEISRFVNDLLQFLFPELNNKRLQSRLEVETHSNLLRVAFRKMLSHTLACETGHIDSFCQRFFEGLEGVYDACIEDSEAILSGDPAARDKWEVVRSYPGFYGIAVYRIAHLMYQIQIPYLPRIFTEYAHSKTGIDIHPGAQIGRRFCIDHGTGVVIGETTMIGNDVKIYQGVTLGALSVRKDMAMQKRHPTIEDGVVIYAGATILGGETVIGHHSVVGGNVWITSSLSPFSIIYYSAEGNQVEKIKE